MGTCTMYYNDLAPCSYFGAELADKLVAVGWLDGEHPYPQGEASEAFLDKLFGLLTRPWAASYFLGYEECPFCGYEYDATYKGKPVQIGALNLFVPGKGFLYVMPSLAAHYILAHSDALPAHGIGCLLSRGSGERAATLCRSHQSKISGH